MAAIAGGGEGGGGEERSRWAWLGTKRVAAVILILLAAEIGYVVHLNTESSSKSATPTTTAPVVPATTAPKQAVTPTTVSPTTTVPATPTTTAPKPATAAATTATTAPLGPCTTSDLDIATTASGAATVGSPMTLTTRVTDVSRCVFEPSAVAPANCPSWISVSGTQSWPSAGEEGCDPPAGQTMNPGSIESISVQWVPSATGTYQAIGTWGWAAASGPPNQVSVPSATFTVGS